MKRCLCLGVLISLFLSLPVFAQEIPEEPEAEEVFLGERIDVGCFNIWLHADGKTWQNTDGLPGAEEPYEGTDLDKDPQKGKYLRYVTFQAEPNQEWEKRYENIRVEASVDWFNTFTKEDYEAAGGGGKASKDGREYVPLNYRLFISKVWECKPHGYQIAPEVSNLTVKFYLHDKMYAEDVKEDDQLDLVEGWRWYLPVHLKFYGVPKPLTVDLEALQIQQTSPVQTNTGQIATGEDPNKVTRSGYGYDLTVKTTYWTNWEKKVPSKATSKGGQLTGPMQVAVQFHDSNEIKELVPMQTETQEHSAGKTIITTWKLPETSHTFPDGETIFETKHYTDVSLQDGKYLVRTIISPCGKGIAETCQDEYVVIYGSMYDDIYTRPAKESEW